MSDVAALFLVKATAGKEDDVAKVASEQWEDEKVPGQKYFVRRGVHWAAVVSGTDNVVVAVRAKNPGDLKKKWAKEIEPRIKEIDPQAATNPGKKDVTTLYADGKPRPMGHNGMP